MDKVADNPLFEIFEQNVARAPDAIAIADGDRRVSFKELGALSEKYARILQSAAKRTEAQSPTVVLHLPKRLETYSLWLACIRLGIVYAFSDPAAPGERTGALIRQLKPALVISEDPLSFDGCITLKELESAPGAEGLEVVDVHPVNMNDPVYVMFTSGSTGTPKGVTIPCIGILNLIRWANLCPFGAQAAFGAERVVLANINSLHFDNSVFDLFCGLLCGRSVVPIETINNKNPASWIKIIRREKVNFIFCVPTLFQTLDKLRLLTPDQMPTVRGFMFGGEGYPVGALKAFHDRFRGQAKLLNVYGPTETSCICSSVFVSDELLTASARDRFPPIGKMHETFKHLIIDEDGSEAEEGSYGELWIGGDNVSLGYYADDDRSGHVFIQNPKNKNFRDIWYRSGDLVKRDRSGMLWFGGRADNQIKINGYRVELEEIDSAVERYTSVERANAVLVEGERINSLTVFYTSTCEQSSQDLASHCREILPPYMIPSKFVFVSELPTNRNGKVDRKKLLSLARTMALPETGFEVASR